MEDKERKGEEVKVTPLNLGTTLRSCGKQFAINLAEKKLDESFQIFVFAIFQFLK
jgi:hypothetical protein